MSTRLLLSSLLRLGPDMKVALLFVCAIAGAARAGSVAWPGAVVTRTVIPQHTKTVAYSTTQYINALPNHNSVGHAVPNFAFEVPQLTGFAPLQPVFYPIASNPITGASYFPAGSVFYPSISPVAPEYPVAGIPSYPSEVPAGQAPSPTGENHAGDADTAVVDSAEFPQQQDEQQVATEAPAQSQPTYPQTPANEFSNYPPVSEQSPSFPQFPQSPVVPQFPQFPFYPQSSTPSPINGFPSQPPSSFPGSDGGDKGLNDEDTISVESA